MGRYSKGFFCTLGIWYITYTAMRLLYIVIYGEEAMTEGTQILISLVGIFVAVMGNIATVIITSKKELKSSDRIDSTTSSTKDNIIEKVNPSLERLNEKNDDIKDELRIVVDDVKQRQAIDAHSGGTLTRNELYANIDKIYEQNKTLSDQLSAANIKIGEVRHELEAARAEIKRLRSVRRNVDIKREEEYEID